MFPPRRFGLVYLVSLLLLIGIITNSLSNYLLMRENVRRTISENSLPLTADNVYSEIQRDFFRPVFIANIMGEETFLRDWVLDNERDEAQIRRYLNSICESHNVATSFFISNNTLKYYHNDGVHKILDKKSEEDAWFFDFKKSAASKLFDMGHALKDTDSPMVYLNFRVESYEGEFLGVAGVGLELNWMQELMNGYAARYGRDICFVNKDADINLATFDGAKSGGKSLYDVDVLKEHVEMILAGDLTEMNFKFKGTQYFLNIRFIPETQNYLLVGQSDEQMLSPLRKHIVTNLLPALIISAIVSFICGLIIQRAHRSLEGQNQELHLKNDKIEKQRKDLEQANESLSILNQEKDDFIGIVAHDLKTPLHGILGLCEVAKLDVEEGVFHSTKFIEELEGVSQRMLDLIQGLLDVAAIESFNDPVELKALHMQRCVSEVFDQFIKHAEKKQINYKLDLRGNTNLELESHAEWLSICLGNLISNAIKYSRIKGDVIVRVENLEDSYQISVIDSGPGFTEKDRALLFGKFNRLSAQPTDGESSNGLGLYIVKKMCDRMGLEVRVENNPSIGARFILSLFNK